jgi:acyl carrier protein
MMKPMTTIAVLENVAHVLRQVLAEEWASDVPISMETSFSSDLELESIEFIALGEGLTECYGQELDFAGWLSGMDLNEIIAMRVGTLVEYIVRCISKRATA